VVRNAAERNARARFQQQEDADRLIAQARCEQCSAERPPTIAPQVISVRNSIGTTITITTTELTTTITMRTDSG
jgi:hypothetical protein